MMETMKYQQVNWVDGMNINKHHLLSLENELTDYVRDAQQQQVGPLSYGLLPAPSPSESSAGIWMNIEHQDKLVVQLDHCRAVTLGGARIEITPAIAEQLRLSAVSLQATVPLIDEEDQDWLVVLSVDPFRRVPVGEADPEETPPRKPYTLPHYAISLVAESDQGVQEFGQYHLTIGKVTVRQGTATQQEDYIPACTSVSSHADLRTLHRRLGQFLSQLERHCLTIIQKIHTKQITNELAVIIHHLCRSILQFTAHEITRVQHVAGHQPPIHLFAHGAGLARLIRNEIDQWQGAGAEQLLTYLSEWCGINQATFEERLSNMIEMRYQHHRLRDVATRTEEFINTTAPLFQKLAELDYIGKKTNTQIFVKEEAVNPAPPEKKSIWRGRFLAD